MKVRKTPRPIAPVAKTTGSIIVKTFEQSVTPESNLLVKSLRRLLETSEQSLIQNPTKRLNSLPTRRDSPIQNSKKRLNSVPTKRDGHAEKTRRLGSDGTWRDNDVEELKGEQAKGVRLQGIERRITNLVDSGVVTCIAVDAEQLDGASDDLQETRGSIDNGRLDSHGLHNSVKERSKKPKTVKMEAQNFRKKDDSMDKHKADKEIASIGEKRPSPSRPALVPLLIKGVPQKGKQIMKSGTQDQDGAALGKIISLERTRQILVEVGTKYGMEFAKELRLRLRNDLLPEKLFKK